MLLKLTFQFLCLFCKLDVLPLVSLHCVTEGPSYMHSEEFQDCCKEKSLISMGIWWSVDTYFLFLGALHCVGRSLFPGVCWFLKGSFSLHLDQVKSFFVRLLLFMPHVGKYVLIYSLGASVIVGMSSILLYTVSDSKNKSHLSQASSLN